jgi:hypothetical protein
MDDKRWSQALVRKSGGGSRGSKTLARRFDASFSPGFYIEEIHKSPLFVTDWRQFHGKG